MGVLKLKFTEKLSALNITYEWMYSVILDYRLQHGKKVDLDGNMDRKKLNSSANACSFRYF